MLPTSVFTNVSYGGASYFKLLSQNIAYTTRLLCKLQSNVYNIFLCKIGRVVFSSFRCLPTKMLPRVSNILFGCNPFKIAQSIVCSITINVVALRLGNIVSQKGRQYKPRYISFFAPTFILNFQSRVAIAVKMMLQNKISSFIANISAVRHFIYMFKIKYIAPLFSHANPFYQQYTYIISYMRIVGV